MDSCKENLITHEINEVEEMLHDVYVGLSEEEMIEHSHHKKLEHTVLLLRNMAVAMAVALFAISLFHVPGSSIYKGIAYFLGSFAYFGEILILTDCFTTRVPHAEMFMAYCFGPMYILLGISYFMGH